VIVTDKLKTYRAAKVAIFALVVIFSLPAMIAKSGPRHAAPGSR
jgi:hypothetical protein